MAALHLWSLDTIVVVHRPSLPEWDFRDLDWLILATTLAVFIPLSRWTGWSPYVCFAMSLLPGWLLATMLRRVYRRRRR